MEDTMGRVVVAAKIESLEDVYRAERGDPPADQIRRIEVTDALSDTGAIALSLPKRMIAQLGLLPLRTRNAITASGVRPVATYGALRLTIEGRDCVCDVTEIDKSEERRGG